MAFRLCSALLAAAAFCGASAPWVPLPPPISCGAVLQPNQTFCIYLRNNCSNVVSLQLQFQSIPGNVWAFSPQESFVNDTWFSFPSLSLAPNASKGFADFSVNVFYNATLTTGAHHVFGLGCIFGATQFDCSFQPGKKFDAQPDEQLDPPAYLGLLFYDKGKGA